MLIPLFLAVEFKILVGVGAVMAAVRRYALDQFQRAGKAAFAMLVAALELHAVSVLAERGAVGCSGRLAAMRAVDFHAFSSCLRASSACCLLLSFSGLALLARLRKASSMGMLDTIGSSCRL